MPDKDPQTGREQASISYEHDFIPQEQGESITVTWSALKPTYRGKEKPDARSLNPGGIQSFSIMMRR